MRQVAIYRVRNFTTGCRRGGLLASATAVLALLFAATALAAPGSLTQKAGADACISEGGSSGACIDGIGLDGATSATVSPDGKNAYVASYDSDAVAIFDRNTTTGALTQKAGTAGCISETGTAGTCTDGEALDGASSVTISPDGASVYAASYDSDAIAIFDRNTTTGALTQKAGTAGCISETGTAGTCTDGKALDSAISVTISPDGTSAYAVSANSDAVAIFDRNTTTGALTQKAGTAGCISETGSVGTCTDGNALNSAHSVTVSPDGISIYVTAGASSAVAIFDRNTTTGALTQKAGTAGCISEPGSADGCAEGNALAEPEWLTVSPDGTSAYVTSGASNAIAIFDRDTTTGTLTQKAGPAGCISETGSAGACVDGKALGVAFSVTISPDGAGVYVASLDSDAIAIFDRDTTTGALTQKAGPAGCISETGTAGTCVDGEALDGAFSVTTSPDGANVYAVAQSSDAVSIFDRDTPPQTTIDSGPSGATKDNTPTFSFSSSEAGSAYQCTVDGGPFYSCSGPGAADTTSALDDGAHTFNVRAVDPAANADPTPATRSFTVDTVDPDVTITRKPKAKTKTEKKTVKLEVRFTSEDGSTFECKLDRADLEPCDSPYKFKAKSKAGNGKKHKITIEATDEAGNVSAGAVAKFKVTKKG